MVTLILIALLITWIMSIVLYKKACRYYYECVSPDSEEVEVIGNIHENPELLEKRR